jgi:peroxiredoxin
MVAMFDKLKTSAKEHNMQAIQEGDTVVLTLSNKTIMGVVKWLSKNGTRATVEVKQGNARMTYPDWDTRNLRAVAS